MTRKAIGLLLISGAVMILIPYTLLTINFDYPAILREDAGVILTRFQEGGSLLIITWWAFALVGFPLLGAYILIGQALESRIFYARIATTIGVISALVQIIGLLRWTFVVPVLAKNYLATNNQAVRESVEITFHTMHQFAGVLLGEHLGQLFTIAWTVMVATAFLRLGLLANWVVVLGYAASAIYLLAQAELFHTVIPAFPVWDWAGFVGSTLWLLWLIVVGISFLRLNIK